MTISSDVVIMTRAELEARDNRMFQRGVKRGRFEERSDISDGKSPMPTLNARGASNRDASAERSHAGADVASGNLLSEPSGLEREASEPCEDGGRSHVEAHTAGAVESQERCSSEQPAAPSSPPRIINLMDALREAIKP